MFITAHGCHLDPLDCQGRKLEDLYIDRSRSPLLKRRACDRWTKGRNEKQERWAHRGPLTAFLLSDVYIWTDPSFTRIWLISSPTNPTHPSSPVKLIIHKTVEIGIIRPTEVFLKKKKKTDRLLLPPPLLPFPLLFMSPAVGQKDYTITVNWLFQNK